MSFFFFSNEVLRNKNQNKKIIYTSEECIFYLWETQCYASGDWLTAILQFGRPDWQTMYRYTTQQTPLSPIGP